MKPLFLIVLLLCVIVTYGQPPTASRTNLCPGTSINFTDQDANNPTTWSWVFEGGTPGSSNVQNPSGIVYNNSGSFDVTLTVTNDLGISVYSQTNMMTVQDCKLSTGVYRIPYADGTDVFVSGDHLTHSPSPMRLDLRGTGGSGGPYTVVAAADGWIRTIVDGFTGCCNGFGACSDCNNYVWIEHPNGEWTKYTHFVTGSVSAYNYPLDTFVCSGTPLGFEGDVGASSGGGRAGIACDGNTALQNSLDSLNAINIGNGGDSIRCAIHLHFEVGIPSDLSNPFDTAGGFLNGENRIPIFCDIPGNIMVDGNQHTANPCDYSSCVDDLLLENQDYNAGDIGIFQADDEITAQNNFEVSDEANVLMSAGNQVRLLPGFSALGGSWFNARIGDCNQSPGSVCNVGLRVVMEELESTDMSNMHLETGLVTYPNPVNDVMHIIYSVEQSGPVSLILVNMYGQEVLLPSSGEYLKAGTVNRMKISTAALLPGVYFCQMHSGDQVKITRFVKLNQ